MSKKQIFIILIAIGIVITLMIVVVPIVVLSGVKTNAVAKQATFIIHDELNDTSIVIERDSYGFNSANDYNKYYLNADIAKMERVVAGQLKSAEVVASGAVLYAYVGGEQFYYLRMTGGDMVPLQGYEYNTSNKSILIKRGEALCPVELYLPYHMINDAVNVTYGSSESRGIFETGKEYALISAYTYNDVVSFYSKFSCFTVENEGTRLLVSHKNGSFYIEQSSSGAIILNADDMCPIESSVPRKR